jgi:predicted secreted protein
MLTRLLIFLSLISVCVSAPVLAATDTNNDIFSVCQKAPTSSVCQDRNAQNANSADNPVNHMIKVAANIIALITGIAAVILIIISGFMFVTAGGAAPGQRSGDPNRIKTARATLTAAIIGLVIVSLAWVIITFLTNRLIKT